MRPWILLRGLTREARHWDRFPQWLDLEVGIAPEGGGMTLLELPGNGHERSLRAPLSVDAMMAFVRARAAAVGIPAPYRLVAMSLGGMVATAWAQQYPEEVERLVLINTSMRPFCSMTQRLRLMAWPVLGGIAARWTQPRESERRLHALTCARCDSLAADIDAWAEIRQTAPVSIANALRQLCAAARFRADRAAPRCPTLLLSSAADRLVDPVCSTRIAQEWHAMHIQHPWAGHDLPHDDPQWTSKRIADWLRTVE